MPQSVVTRQTYQTFSCLPVLWSTYVRECIAIPHARCSSGSPVVFAVAAPAVCTLSGTTLTNVVAATLNGDRLSDTDQIVVSAALAATGDTQSTNNYASATTTAAIFRDGFEPGGDGAQNRNMQQP